MKINDNQGDNPLVLVAADIIWIDQYTSHKVRSLISKKYNIPKSNVCICASHTHGTYNIDKDFLFNNYSEEYRNHIEKSISFLKFQMTACWNILILFLPQLTENQN